jgi:hypothetical protein
MQRLDADTSEGEGAPPACGCTGLDLAAASGSDRGASGARHERRLWADEHGRAC